MLYDQKGNRVILKSKQINTVYYSNIVERIGVNHIEERLDEVPGGMFELGKRVKYGKRGCAPVQTSDGLANIR